MKKNITRRDFLNGTQIAIGAAVSGSLLSPWTETFGSAKSFSLGNNYYPPAKTGLRGMKWQRFPGHFFTQLLTTASHNLLVTDIRF